MDWIKKIDYLQTHELDTQLEFQTFEVYNEDLLDAHIKISLQQASNQNLMSHNSSVSLNN